LELISEYSKLKNGLYYKMNDKLKEEREKERKRARDQDVSYNIYKRLKSPVRPAAASISTHFGRTLFHHID